MPRAGSTLLQRLLSTHPKISTCSEPWLLLPYLYTLKPKGVFTEYNHQVCFRAFQDFIAQMPQGESDYYDALYNFSMRIYKKLMDPQAKYFLDKTPRYYLIIPHIAEIFPKAKFIFLFRNPLQILASVISTWNSGRLRFEENYMDLFYGPRLLSEGYQKLSQKALKIQFENLVTEPDLTLKNIFDYLELDFDKNLKNNFNRTKLKGRMGDPKGTHDYTKISNQPMDKWKNVINTRFRKKYAKKYLSILGSDILNTFGYEREDLNYEIKQIHTKFGVGLVDRIDLMVSFIFRLFEIPLFKKKMKHKLVSRRHFILHN